MAAISQKQISNQLPWMKWSYQFCSSQQQVVFGSDNGLAANSRQIIILSNNDLVYWRIYESLGLDKIILD